MKRNFKLNQEDIKSAIMAFVASKAGLDDTTKLQVSLTATEARDHMDRVSYGYVISATVDEK